MQTSPPKAHRQTARSTSGFIDTAIGLFSLHSLPSLNAGEHSPHFSLLRTLFPKALIVEPAPRAVLPTYSGRQTLRAAISAARRSSGCLLFTDPAHSVFVISWRSAENGVLLEYRIPDSTQALERALTEEAELPNAGRKIPKKRATARPTDPQGAGHAALRYLATRLGAGAEHHRGFLVMRIEALDDVDELRAAWRALDDLRVLDAEGPDGGRWLLDAARSLEPVYLALSSRTRSFVQDALSAGKHRPEFLKDLRNRLDLIDSQPGMVGPRVTVRRILGRQNLFGIRRHPQQARSLRGALAEYAQLPRRPTAYLDLNVSRRGFVGVRDGAIDDPATPEPSATMQTGSGSSMTPSVNAGETASTVADTGGSPEILALRLAWTLVRNRRGGDQQDELEDGRSAHQLERRRRQLTRGANLCKAVGDLATLTAAAFPWTAGDAFQVVRGEGRR